MSKPSLTILTDPVGTVKANTRLWIKKNILHRRWGGHPAVTRSLIEGFEKIGYEDYNLNPFFESDIAERVHVLAGVKSLQYAIELKRRGKIKFLSAGPNVVSFSTDYNGLIASPEVDLYLQPSQWACNCHIERRPDLAGRCVPWPAGVDLSILEPTKYNRKEGQVLLYHKYESDQFAFRVETLLKRKGYRVICVRYGSYIFEDYIKALGESEFAVVVARQESQGLYLVEAWAMGVPTLCFEPHCCRWNYSDETYDFWGSSTAPYLTETTGAEWFELSELETLLDNMEQIKEKADPRKWVEEHMTDEICAENFLRCIGVARSGADR